MRNERSIQRKKRKETMNYMYKRKFFFFDVSFHSMDKMERKTDKEMS